jgi:bacillithiol biosynthesis deacetylase BshB1
MTQAINLDILAFGAHPDDVELTCSGTLIKHMAMGYKAGIVDLTMGELGSRGSAEIRKNESEQSSKVLGIQARENLELKDGFFRNDEEHQRLVISAIRKYRPHIVLCNAIRDRHSDHGRAASLVADSCFLSGLRKIETRDVEGKLQEHWRPAAVYHYIQDRYIIPDLVVDITAEWDKKMESIRCFKSQFYDPSSSQPTTPISGEDYFDFLAGRFRETGRLIQVKYAEGFTVARAPGVQDLMQLI